jgi:AAA15 family ATPase/GTPase
MLHRSTWLLVDHLSHAIDTGAKERSVEILRMFDRDVNDVLISRSIGRDTIRVDHAKKGMVDLSTFGDGMRRAFAMSLALTHASGGILLVDEFESAIHTQLLDSILPWLVQAAGVADVQIVATTHSLEAIDAVIGAVADGPSGVVTYYLRSTEAGRVCTRYDLAGLRDLRDEGLDIR